MNDITRKAQSIVIYADNYCDEMRPRQVEAFTEHRQKDSNDIMEMRKAMSFVSSRMKLLISSVEHMMQPGDTREPIIIEQIENISNSVRTAPNAQTLLNGAAPAMERILSMFMN